MNIQDYVLELITYKIMAEMVKEDTLKIKEKLGHLAIQILETENEEYKIMLLEKYNKLKRLNDLDIENITLKDLDYKAMGLIKDKINCIFQVEGK